MPFCGIFALQEAPNIPWANNAMRSPLHAGVFCLVLFHPDYTVGSGLSPDLLTFRLWRPEALAGSGKIPIPPVGNCTPP
ncbi:hypothetical protein ASD46_21130 [Rhizobium sp. Root491]|jgi:hypothetical protein|nr:hypothetical protein AGROH133_15085 [Agrobacterium tumefaciens]KQY36928.1 hypothetical protein ASD46_21130 [Rhizobium sp. Root491]